jgi:hypothetical protein
LNKNKSTLDKSRGNIPRVFTPVVIGLCISSGELLQNYFSGCNKQRPEGKV